MSSLLKFALILLAAAVLTVIVRVLFVSGSDENISREDNIRVRVAAATLPAGLLMREGDLSWKTYTKSQLPKGALVEGSDDAILYGALVRRQVTAGTPITAEDIIRPNAPGFLAAVLKPGSRAVSVPIDDVSGNAGLIQPGDFVDIILTQRLNQAENSLNAKNRLVVSETVVERVRVIAVGSEFQRRIDENSKPNRARTVTIEVAQRAAEAVTVAAQLGSLSMALRSFAVEDRNMLTDNDPLVKTASVVAWSSDLSKENQPVWGNDISRALSGEQDASAEKQPPALTSHRVIILRGSQRQEQEFTTYAR